MHLRVDLLHDPVEQSRVDVLGARVARVVGLQRLQRHVDRLLAADAHLARGQPVVELALGHAEEPRGRGEVRGLLERDLRAALLDLDVADVQDGGQDLEAVVEI